MTETYKIEGMTCGSCKASVEKVLLGFPDVSEATVNLEKGEAQLTMSKAVSEVSLRSALPKKYTIAKKESGHELVTTVSVPISEKSKLQQLKPLFLILLYISVAVVLMHFEQFSMRMMMLDFMGLFFIVFSFFKMLDLKGFPGSFSMYDPLAKRLPLYAQVYPFIEVALGLMFLMRYQISIALIITIFVLGITTIGVAQTLFNKKAIRCACLGTALNLPMTEATFVQNTIMLIMSLALIVGF